MDDAPPEPHAADGAPPAIRLLPGRSRRVRGGHPWVYSNEVEMTREARAVAPGTIVTVVDAGGERLGAATFNPEHLVAARMLSTRTAPEIGRDWIADRLERALALRERLFDRPYYRLVHGEADGLPGLVVDRYDGVHVAQLNSAGMDRLGAEVESALFTRLSAEGVVLRRDGSGRRFEGLPSAPAEVSGRVDGPVAVVENGCRFLADPVAGQKTGWFFDHRENRARAAALARGGRVLDLYCYLGGFGLQAAERGAASVLGVDRSEPALALAREAAGEAGVGDRCRFVRGDAFGTLEGLRRGGEAFDLVVADPPAFVKVRKDLKPGLTGYRKLVRLAAAVTAPDGMLCAASCSFHVDAAAFGEQIGRGLRDAGRSGRILHVGGAGPDHPVHPSLAESAYLTCYFLQLD